MSNVQVKMMKNIFENYKTPTMPECLGLGNDIGLQKRVVQVWFQNARAKEKKARLYLQQVTGETPNGGAKETGNKRFRTHMSNVHVKMMKNIFENYKTPTMPECLGLGNDI